MATADNQNVIIECNSSVKGGTVLPLLLIDAILLALLMVDLLEVLEGSVLLLFTFTCW